MKNNSTPKRANKFMLLFVIYQLMISFILFNVPPVFNFFRSLSLPYIIIFQQILIFAPPILLYFLITGEDFDEAIPSNKLGVINILFITLLSLMLAPFAMILSGISSIFFPNNVSDFMEGMKTYPLYVSILSIAVTPAIFEELTFRGIVFSNYKNINVKKGALLSGLFFGIMHLNAQQFVYAFILGVVIAYFVHHTKSIHAGMLSHFVINLSSVLLMYSYSGNSEQITTPMEPLSLLSELLLAFLLLSWLLPLIYILYNLFVKYNLSRTIIKAIIKNDISLLKKSEYSLKIVDGYFITIILLYISYVALQILL